jgi:hypothetical protein
MKKHNLTPDEILRAAKAFIAIEQSELKRWDDLEMELQEAMKGVGTPSSWKLPFSTSLAISTYVCGLQQFLPEISRDEAERAMRRLMVDSPARVALGVLERYASEVSNYVSPVRKGVQSCR